MVDNIELLQDNQKNYRNLNLTYAVRDGIISHCGEVDQNGIFPRKEAIQYYRPFVSCFFRAKNNKIYGNLETEEIYAQAIVDFISGMTDRYAVTVFNELLHY